MQHWFTTYLFGEYQFKENVDSSTSAKNILGNRRFNQEKTFRKCKLNRVFFAIRWKDG